MFKESLAKAEESIGQAQELLARRYQGSRVRWHNVIAAKLVGHRFLTSDKKYFYPYEDSLKVFHFVLEQVVEHVKQGSNVGINFNSRELIKDIEHLPGFYSDSEAQEMGYRDAQDVRVACYKYIKDAVPETDPDVRISKNIFLKQIMDIMIASQKTTEEAANIAQALGVDPK